LNSILAATSPEFLKKKHDNDERSVQQENQDTYKLKSQGVMNYEAIVAQKEKNSNIIRDNYERDFYRNEDIKRYYSDMREQLQVKESQQLQKHKQEKELEVSRASKEVEQYNNWMEQQRLEEIEKKRKYAEDLRKQMDEDLHRHSLQNKMTRTEKRLNIDNLQVPNDLI